MNYKITVKNNKDQKYLFLDIDGVLNSFDDYKMTGEEFLKKLNEISFIVSKKQIRLLNEIIEEYNPKIVLSSYWRTRYDLKEINKMFKDNGFLGQIVGMTDEDGAEHKQRWAQIKRYIGKHNVKNFIILDDDKLGEGAYNHIKTNSYIGLGNKHMKEIEKIWK
jgi:histidinol phosphatase-like enzyme